MPSRKLTPDEATASDAMLATLKDMVTEAAGGDPVLLFALRRRLFLRLMYWERSSPAERNKLKREKWKSQEGRCGICGGGMVLKGSELNRADPLDAYTAENTKLVHPSCHRADQEGRGVR